jgi:hypothetical protein
LIGIGLGEILVHMREMINDGERFWEGRPEAAMARHSESLG